MTTSLSTTQPSAPPRAPAGYAVTVRRARGLLWALIVALLVAGALATLVSFAAAQSALNRYRAIVADSSISADAAQEARSSLLAYHSAAATFLSEQGQAGTQATLNDGAWREYQEAQRRLWQNRRDETHGEFELFDAADRATLRYKGQIDAMLAFVRAGDGARAQETFLTSHDVLVRELLPALNGLESLKLENMEEAYATTQATVSRWQQGLLVVGGGTVLLLLLGVVLTRFWLHYGWTWELALALVAAIALFTWFNVALWYAADQVERLVRDAYDTISGVQAVEALLTQADALESMAVFDRDRAPAFLSDANDYLFLVEQRLCGEPIPSCTAQSFLDAGGQDVSDRVRGVADDAQSKYGLPRPPLVANATFQGEPQALEALREGIKAFREANDQLEAQVGNGGAADPATLEASRRAFEAALSATTEERRIARNQFDFIYRTVTAAMQLNRWLALLFLALAVLGYWGLRRRRQALFP